VRFLKQFNDFGLKGYVAVLGNATITDEGILRVMGDEAVGFIRPDGIRPDGMRRVSIRRTTRKNAV
jgi:hypothetical protein